MFKCGILYKSLYFFNKNTLKHLWSSENFFLPIKIEEFNSKLAIFMGYFKNPRKKYKNKNFT